MSDIKVKQSKVEAKRDMHIGDRHYVTVEGQHAFTCAQCMGDFSLSLSPRMRCKVCDANLCRDCYCEADGLCEVCAYKIQKKAMRSSCLWRLVRASIGVVFTIWYVKHLTTRGYGSLIDLIVIFGFAAYFVIFVFRSPSRKR